MLKLSAIQINNIDAESIIERNKNIDLAIDLINSIPQETDLVLLPELSVTGYSEATFEQLDIIAEQKEGKSFERFAEIAKKKNSFVSYGYTEVDDQQKYYISQNVINRNGELVDTYRKMHLAHFGDSMEKDYFTEGKHLVSFTIEKQESIYNIGIIICYDMRFPELTRKLALQKNIDLLLHPVAFAKDHSFPSWHHFIITRALENQIYLMSLNRAGDHFGNSIFCPPWIDYNKKPSVLNENETILNAEIDKKEIELARKTYSLRNDLKSKY